MLIFCYNLQGASAEIKLETGKLIKITTDDAFYEKGSLDIIWVDYKNIIKVLKVGNRMFIDDGLISVIVREVGKFGFFLKTLSLFLWGVN